MMRARIAAAAVLAMSAVVLVEAAPAQAATYYVDTTCPSRGVLQLVKATTNVRVRPTASTEGPALGILPAGRYALLLQRRSDGWNKIAWPPLRTIGHVSARYAPGPYLHTCTPGTRVRL